MSQLAGPDVSGYTASFRDLASNQARCELRAGVIGVTLALDSSPQPYQRLEREIVEDGQQFGTVREFSPPQAVSGVGLDAAWIPDQSRLITADSHRLVTVTVTWPGSGSARRRGLARALALSTLGP